jgi:Icc-related predicted phosphoesterase
VTVWRRHKRADTSFSLYYASDVHGSDVCWRKFVNARQFYKVDALVMGGDLTGKAVVPIARAADGAYRATFLGEVHDGPPEDLDRLLGAIRYNGMYPWLAAPEEITAAAGDAVLQGEVFERAMLDELRRWMDLTRAKLGEDAARVYAMAGNDDPWSVDEVLAEGLGAGFCDERVVALPSGQPLVSCSYANRTPWDSPRELPEDDLYAKLRGLLEQVADPATCILNAHVPPFDSGLDRATELDADFRPVLRGGVPHEIPVGSHAVRQIIEEYQPVLAVHGHIHESRGETRIGRTLVVNPGSEYTTGRIHGLVARFAGDELVSHQLVVG